MNLSKRNLMSTGLSNDDRLASDSAYVDDAHAGLRGKRYQVDSGG